MKTDPEHPPSRLDHGLEIAQGVFTVLAVLIEGLAQMVSPD